MKGINCFGYSRQAKREFYENYSPKLKNMNYGYILS